MAVIIAIAVIVVIGVLVGLFGEETPDDSSAPASPASENSMAAESSEEGSVAENTAEADTIIPLGESGTYEDETITVTGVEKSSGDQFDTPKEGMEYVIVSLKIQNTGKKIFPIILLTINP